MLAFKTLGLGFIPGGNLRWSGRHSFLTNCGFFVIKMFVLSNLLIAVARVLDIVLSILWWLILIRVLISWISPDPYNLVVRFLYKTTEPVLYPIRRLLPLGLMFGIDISPIIAFLAIMFLRAFLVRTLIDLAMRLR